MPVAQQGIRGWEACEVAFQRVSASSRCGACFSVPAACAFSSRSALHRRPCPAVALPENVRSVHVPASSMALALIAVNSSRRGSLSMSTNQRQAKVTSARSCARSLYLVLQSRVRMSLFLQRLQLVDDPDQPRGATVGSRRFVLAVFHALTTQRGSAIAGYCYARHGSVPKHTIWNGPWVWRHRAGEQRGRGRVASACTWRIGN